jgi:nucleoid DNA-binding protein
MTKTELQTALAEATQTEKKAAGVFLDTLSALANKEIKKNGVALHDAEPPAH